MNELVLDALKDSAMMIPFLLVIYFVVGWLEYYYGSVIRERIQRAAKAGPLLGAFFGSIPQCGFSVLGSALYARRLITTGTLLAVFLSTSDEAIPVILAQPSQAHFVLPLIGMKIVIAVLGGYGVDLAMRSYGRRPTESDPKEADDIHEHGCCEHHVEGRDARRELLMHPITHTAKVFLFVFVVTLAINYLIFAVGEKNLGNALLFRSPLQPVIAAMIGLIPNCAASVAIAEMFLKGGLTYGAAIAGLSSSAGVGLLVLLKENHDARDTIKVLALLLGISIAAGLIIQYTYG